MKTTYATRDEAIQREITEALHGYATEFDIDAIADETIEYRVHYTPEGAIDLNRCRYAITVNASEFWTIVQNHEI